MRERRLPWARSFSVWLVIIAAETVHRTLRQFSVVTGTVLIFLVALVTARWLGARDRPSWTTKKCRW